uniref:ATP synthase F0 subunit 6 n=1 Tax=Cavelerius yunnanensis TaxID=2969358 RepID=UPI00206BF55B|nr:ATP synthase F0 subunit 6 [Cavelerius yunnanensis]UPL65537.1 ATPase subunit 6 [Cavelerius excavatus]UUJ37742.1 ATP synthase F0 subunit 6 [Cavelerius yunnanensis]
MMNNLFSTFDPSTSMKLSLNWISSVTCLAILPMYYWYLPNRISMLSKSIMWNLNKEFSMILGEKNKSLNIMMISLFTFILLNNIMGIMPYIFTSSSHLTFSLSMALPMWVSLMMFGWINKTNYMFSHLIPTGTPAMLMPFMVMIETISNIMRPGSLAVRLTANMIAGHLMMSLLGNNSIKSNFLIIFFMQFMLMMFESAVALIQAYVFSVLSTLYSSEIN